MPRPLVLAVVVLATVLASSLPAAAEIVFFASGRTMTVKAHREQEGRLVLVLAGGGEVVCEASTIVRIAPDEIPMFDPPPAAAATAAEAVTAYDPLIDAAAERHGVNPKLVRAVIQIESAYRAQARSRKGAMGLMQLMPDTARRFAVANPYDPSANIEAGTKYLKTLLGRFDVALALAAYNAGEAAVERFGGIPPYAETRSYVQSVMKLAGLSR